MSSKLYNFLLFKGQLLLLQLFRERFGFKDIYFLSIDIID